MDRRKIDVIISAILISVSLMILIRDDLTKGGMETELGSMFIPRLIAVFIILFSGIIGAQAIINLSRKAPKLSIEHIDTTGFIGVIIYFLIFILYWLIVPHVGFILTTPFVIFAVAYLLGGRSWLPIGATSIITPILIYYGCSQYLRVFLPTWSLS